MIYIFLKHTSSINHHNLFLLLQSNQYILKKMSQKINLIDYEKRYKTDFEVDPFQEAYSLKNYSSFGPKKILKRDFHYSDNNSVFEFFGFLIEQPQTTKIQTPVRSNHLFNAAIQRIANEQERRQTITNINRNQQEARQFYLQINQQPTDRQVENEAQVRRERRSNTAPGLSISAVKGLNNLLIFGGLFVRRIDRLLETSRCFQRLKQVLSMFSSKVGVKRQLRMLFNLNDPALNQSIRNNPNRTRAETYFLLILDQFDVDIVDDAKRQLKHLLIEIMTPEWMRDRAYTRAFNNGIESPETTYLRKHFHHYLQHLRENLREEHGILETLDRREFDRQFEGHEE